MQHATLREPLTLRQVQFIADLANGMSFNDIARRDYVTHFTPRNALQQARRTAGVRTNEQLVALAVSAGLVVWDGEHFVGP